jgi:hypothetical protein
MTNAFDGIVEKLKRTDECIHNLQTEITRFFQECEYPILPQLGDKTLLEAIHYHNALPIPLRFSVLAGEIVHHLRSSLDHVVWELSSEAYRLSSDHRFIEFPILETRPTFENKFTRYKRKVQGVHRFGALKLIAALQPYRRIDPVEDLLLIMHKMDIAYKHRELVLFNTTGTVENLPNHVAFPLMRYLRGDLKAVSAEFKREFNKYGKVTPQISFMEFGRREIQSVVPGLIQLRDKVIPVIAAFETFLT